MKINKGSELGDFDGTIEEFTASSLPAKAWTVYVEPEPQPYVPTEEERISALWQAAHDYEYKEISGSAVGILAIGVMQGLPKCLAVQAWIKSIWELYYTRKFGTSTDTDYSSCGACPYSVPELMSELGL